MCISGVKTNCAQKHRGNLAREAAEDVTAACWQTHWSAQTVWFSVLMFCTLTVCQFLKHWNIIIYYSCYKCKDVLGRKHFWCFNVHTFCADKLWGSISQLVSQAVKSIHQLSAAYLVYLSGCVSGRLSQAIYFRSSWEGPLGSPISPCAQKTFKGRWSQIRDQRPEPSRSVQTAGSCQMFL